MIKLNVVGILWKRRFLATVRRFHMWRSQALVAVQLEDPRVTAVRSTVAPLSPALTLSRSASSFGADLMLDLDSLAMSGIDLQKTRRMATPRAAPSRNRKDTAVQSGARPSPKGLVSPGLVSPLFNRNKEPI